MTTTPRQFDPVAYKTTTRAQWETAADSWHAWGPTIEAWLGPATELMLDLAGVSAGGRVLDIAAGAGGQTLAAARRVGARGAVLATDISPAILRHADRAAADAGLNNVLTRVMDAEALEVEPATYDAAISRVGLIYLPDREAALAGMRRALRPGGRAAAIVYSTAERNGFFSLPVSIIRRRAELPPPAPGPARPVQPRRGGRPRFGPPRGGVPRRGGQDGHRAPEAVERRGVRALRARVLRRPAPDARRARRRRARGGMGGGRARAGPLRGPGRLHRRVRACRGRGHR